MTTIGWLLRTAAVLAALTAPTDGKDFCQLKTLDNVYNIGQYIYLSRCGEVYTWDPRMDGGQGGLLRDYSIYALARKELGKEQKPNGFDKDTFRFTAFSFQEVNCLESPETLDRICGRSVDKWNGVTVIVGYNKALTFRYRTSFESVGTTFDNPFGFQWREDLTIGGTGNRNLFWPTTAVLSADMRSTHTLKEIVASLFVVANNLLYLGFNTTVKNQTITKGTYFCVTVTNLKDALHDINRWENAGPSIAGKPTNAVKPAWSTARCFVGNFAGMFYDENKNRSYLVGQGITEDNLYLDQVFEITGGDTSIILSVVNNDKRTDKPTHLRAYFGCDLTDAEVNDATNAQRLRQEKRIGSRRRRSASVPPENTWKDWIQHYGHLFVEQYKQEFTLHCQDNH
ncbi:unnamed protein product [Medioppia subpectinata]|uniref:Uncharacterized protein n=1 Tax=Medioppia subpectinata TaxID=1979941 RepID=A0A7R9Q689_9ACAR|nr:unnamed protein product [Medioppia subpectinata]CAG2114164.1 unnamed protein product [Medioppia subpectinata]